ncbi:hypothetical protein QYF36_009612 [Acer negundo]|nr:hypothetical protein QYF36_009612 [Acer negundo]
MEMGFKAGFRIRPRNGLLMPFTKIPKEYKQRSKLAGTKLWDYSQNESPGPRDIGFRKQWTIKDRIPRIFFIIACN